MTSIQPLLSRLDACQAARTWAGDRDLATAWRDCPRGDWLLWLAARLGVDRRLVIQAACASARTSLHLIPAGEDRPRLAIEVAEAWSRGDVSREDLLRAYAAYAADADAYAADAYAAAAAAAAARAAAAAAADAADADAAHADTAYAATAAAAYAAAYAAASDDASDDASDARAVSLARSAELVREIIPVDAILAAATPLGAA